jgi:hypothetical protein
MIFNHLKYLKPIWYFNLKSNKDFCYFPADQQLKDNGFYLEKDNSYKSKIAQNHDLAWNAFQSGFISNDEKAGVDIWKENTLPIQDEYRFLRKNFHSAWVLYVLLIRLITFHNPFKEVKGFLKTRNVKRVDYSINILNDVSYEVFESTLVASNPFISVVIPTLNRYEYLKDVLKDLENQTYKNFEVIIVDQTDDFRKPGMKLFNQQKEIIFYYTMMIHWLKMIGFMSI